MSKGIYTAVSGAIAQSAKLDTIANNLANVNTPGFKRDSQVFKEYLTAYEKEQGTITVPRIPASIESFYDTQGGDKAYVDNAGTYTDFTQGSLRQTGNKLDLAIEGDGFMEVGTPDGVRFTRVGSLAVDAEGRLITKQGFPILRDGGEGAPAAGREIRLQSADVTIAENGEIFDGGQSVGRLGLVKFGNKDALRKVGQNMFTLKDNLEAQRAPASEAKVHQGALEGSNVNVVREMTEMIAATRTFESTQKAIQAYDSMAGKAVNELPKLK
ncbi:MAG TPA: flagellar basal-body rod protein FlgF [Bdellovibrionales bacterium]|jgi:flagellar basal-body rod protein FlgG|nr:flagellar basal-body rod protein FlgF [Bdellovibrionales bacterium]